MSKRENSIRQKFSNRGRNWRQTEFTLTEGVLMDENQNETKDIFLIIFLFKFHCNMTCSVAINAKEGDCWYT